MAFVSGGKRIASFLYKWFYNEKDFYEGIALKAVTRNYRACDLIQVVLMDKINKTYEAFTLDKLEKLAKK